MKRFTNYAAEMLLFLRTDKLRIALLSSMRANERNQFQLDMHLPGS